MCRGRKCILTVITGVMLAVVPHAVTAQETLWQKWQRYNSDALEALQQGDWAKGAGDKDRYYSYAEAQMALAVREAERIDTGDPHFVASLNNLAIIYKVHGKWAEAAPLLQCIVQIAEKTYGPNSPAVFQSLRAYSETLKKLKRNAEAAQLDKQAKSIMKQNAALLRKANRVVEAEQLESVGQYTP